MYNDSFVNENNNDNDENDDDDDEAAKQDEHDGDVFVDDSVWQIIQSV